jgi:hypothetical protein
MVGACSCQSGFRRRHIARHVPAIIGTTAAQNAAARPLQTNGDFLVTLGQTAATYGENLRRREQVGQLQGGSTVDDSDPNPPVRAGSRASLQTACLVVSETQHDAMKAAYNDWHEVLSAEFFAPGHEFRSTVLYIDGEVERDLAEGYGLTAQRMLARHLHPGADKNHPTDTFWADINLDLTGATLLDFIFRGSRIDTVLFGQARFVGNTAFNGTSFAGNAGFHGASGEQLDSIEALGTKRLWRRWLVRLVSQ